MKDRQLAYSIPHACKLISVGRTTLYSAIKAGEIKVRKVGRRSLITHEELALWLDRLPLTVEARDDGQGAK
jgi:excisionase family DNA binding protein